MFHSFCNYDCHLFFKRLVDRENDKVEFDIAPKTNEEYITVTYWCIKFVDSCRFLSSSWDALVQSHIVNNHKTLKKLKKEIVCDNNISNIVNELETLISEDRTIANIKLVFPYELERLEEALKNINLKKILNFWKQKFVTNGNIQIKN